MTSNDSVTKTRHRT